jgi:hypothetical protein
MTPPGVCPFGVGVGEGGTGPAFGAFCRVARAFLKSFTNAWARA